MDGAKGWEQLAPDRQIVSVGYALTAGSVTGTVAASALPSGVTVGFGVAAGRGAAVQWVSICDDDCAAAVGDGGDGGSAIGAERAERGLGRAIFLGVGAATRGSSSPNYLNTGQYYDPVADQWQGMSPVNAPEARSGQTTVWTGSSMIVWGGVGANGSAGDRRKISTGRTDLERGVGDECADGAQRAGGGVDGVFDAGVGAAGARMGCSATALCMIPRPIIGRR